jgi:uncharacterized membrane protein
MKPLVVLVVSFLLSFGIIYCFTSVNNIILSGNIAMCIMLCFTAIGHFKFARGMAMMIPRFVPFKKQVVLITGILEIVMGIALLFETYRQAAGIAVVVFFMLMLPANVSAALKNVDYEQATYTGKGLKYLWFRVPMQFFLISWVIYFSIC